MRRSFIMAALGATFLAGCTVQPPGDTPVAVARGPVPTKSATPMDQALGCLALNLAPDFDMRLAVHSLPDRTGVNDYDGPGAYVTQGAELMMVSALAKAGVRQVNRTATSIAEWELSQAMEQRLGDGARVVVGDTSVAFRPIQAGQYLGSTHTVYGGITELDFDLLSDGFEAHIAGIGGKARGYYIGIGLDIVVADSRSTEIVLARSYRKQIWGQELEANLFRFWDIGSGGNDIGDVGVELFDLRLGRQQNEPIHQSVRWVVEHAAYEMVRDLGGIGHICEAHVPETGRSEPSRVALAAPRGTQFATVAAPEPVTGAAAPAELSAMPPVVTEATSATALDESPSDEPATMAGPPPGNQTADERRQRASTGRILRRQDR